MPVAPMRSLPTSSAAVVVLLCVAALLHSATAGRCAELAPFVAPASLQYPHVCQAEQGWKAIPALWAPVEVVVNCSSSSYTMVTSGTEQQLRDEVDLSPVNWCGFRQLVSEPAVCRLSLSPLQDNYLAVQAAESSGLFGKGGPAELVCEVHSSQELSLLHLALTAAGVLLYFNAAGMSMSATFRLTSGSLMFMSGAVVVLSFMLMRSVPYKRSMVAFFTLSSTSMMAAVRWLYGTWLPDMHSLLSSRPFLYYIAITGLLGLAVTYWMDDTSNVKLNTTIRVTLRLVGLLLVYLGIADERVALGVMAFMVASGVLAAVGRRLVMLAWLLIRHTALLLRWLLRSTWRIVSFSTSRAASVAAAAPAAVARAAGRGRADSLDAAAGSPLPDYDDAAEPLLSDEEEERTASKRKQLLRRRAWQHAAQQQQQLQLEDEQEEEEQQHQPPHAFNKVGSFNEWAAAAPRAGAAAAGEHSPLHLRQGPPLSPAVLAVQPNLQQHQWRQQEVPMRQQAAAAPAPAAAAGYDAGSYSFPSSTPRAAAKPTPPAAARPKSSPWSNERLVMDVDSRQAVSPPPPPQLSPAAAAGQGSVSPLVQQGKILNPVSGKVIMFNKPAYNQLVSQGYTPDLTLGVMVPPGGGAAAAAPQAPASGAGRAAMPGSQVRQRVGKPRSRAAGTPR